MSTYKAQFGAEQQEVENLLQNSDMEVLGQIEDSSNQIFLVQLDGLKGVYKPLAGERPLHDFPDELYKREVAAYELDKLIGWNLVPPTVITNGQFGVGSIQAFVEADFTEHYFTLVKSQENHTYFKRLSLFDFIANNTDRKSGHCLSGKSLWAIDNGLCFHAQYKLRTVIWDFAGEEIAPTDLEVLSQLDADSLKKALTSFLDPIELDATTNRLKVLVDNKVMPLDETGGKRWPWPPI